MPNLRKSVLVLAPVGRDATLLEASLKEHGFDCVIYESADELLNDFHEAGVVILTEEVLTQEMRAGLQTCFQKQPPWSNVPVLLLITPPAKWPGEWYSSPDHPARPNVTMLERPLRNFTFISAVETALFTRQRQYEVRDLLRRLEDAKRSLEQRVHQRTREVREKNEQVSGLLTALSEAENKERSRVANLLHDDLQQILIALRMQAELGSQADNAQQQHDGFERISELAAKALKSTRTLVSELKPPLDYPDQLQEALEWLTKIMQERYEVEFAFHSEADKPPIVEDASIRSLLFRTARELLFNVVKHSGSARADLHLATEGPQIVISVEDHGYGFDIERARQEATPGHLGLFELEQRLQAIRGSIHIQTSPGQGTRITFKSPPLSARGLQEPLHVTEPLKVMVVDDHRIVREGLKMIIDLQEDMTVVGEATDGKEAVKLCTIHHPDIMLMDIQLPDIDGIEATRLIRKLDSPPRIIGLTFYTRDDLLGAMRDAGAEEVFNKNVPSSILLKHMRRPPSARI